jgi:hypothetical protein
LILPGRLGSGSRLGDRDGLVGRLLADFQPPFRVSACSGIHLLPLMVVFRFFRLLLPLLRILLLLTARGVAWGRGSFPRGWTALGHDIPRGWSGRWRFGGFGRRPFANAGFVSRRRAGRGHAVTISLRLRDDGPIGGRLRRHAERSTTEATDTTTAAETTQASAAITSSPRGFIAGTGAIPEHDHLLPALALFGRGSISQVSPVEVVEVMIFGGHATQFDAAGFHVLGERVNFGGLPEATGGVMAADFAATSLIKVMCKLFGGRGRFGFAVHSALGVKYSRAGGRRLIRFGGGCFGDRLLRRGHPIERVRVSAIDHCVAIDYCVDGID